MLVLPLQRRPCIVRVNKFYEDIADVSPGNRYLITLGKTPVAQPGPFKDNPRLIIGGFGYGQGPWFLFHCASLNAVYI
jgi:hypothetical protein